METDATLAPVDREESLAAKVYRRLRGALMCGRLKPGQRLVHRLLAADLGVSPTPVREALLRLVSEGALELDARGIAWVPRLAPDRYAEILELRVELEGRAAARAAEQATPADLSALRATHQLIADARRRVDVQTVLTENERFHFRLMEVARLPVTRRLLESLWVQAGPTISLLFEVPRETEPARHPHVALLAALETRDPEAARAAMVRDLREHGSVIAAQLARHRAEAEAPAERAPPRARGADAA